jgi:hypothetical protein
MLYDRSPLSWRERNGLRHLQCGHARSDASFPAGVGRETLDTLCARGLATKRPDLDRGGFVFTITSEGQLALAGFLMRLGRKTGQPVVPRSAAPRPLQMHALEFD